MISGENPQNMYAFCLLVEEFMRAKARLSLRLLKCQIVVNHMCST